MLVLPVQDGNTLVIEMEDFDITVAFLGLDGDMGRIGIEAPREYSIRRGYDGRGDIKASPGKVRDPY